MKKFYVIKLVNEKTGANGFVIDSPDGIILANEYVIEVKQFHSHTQARQFIFDNKLEQKRTKAYIRSSEDLMDEGGAKNLKPLQGEVFYIEDEEGYKLFYDTKEDSYYFELREVGQCCWHSKSDTEKFIEAMQFDCKTIIKSIKQ